MLFYLYPGEVLPTAKTTKEMLPIRYGVKKPQSYTKDTT